MMSQEPEKEITRENEKQHHCCIETVFITITDAVSKPHHEQTYDNIPETVAAVGKTLANSNRKDTQNDTQNAQKYHQVCHLANTLTMIDWRFLIHLLSSFK